MALLPLLLLYAAHSSQMDATLPAGVHAEWSLAKAWREKTPTRERVCLNGLWRWQPGGDALPQGGWGWFKVPGCWPGITNYLQKDCQTVFRNPAWQDVRLDRLTSAWYQRSFTVPAGWSGRRITLSASYVNSLATAYLDGTKAGEILFPSGELDLTRLVRPGETHILSIQVVALPLKAVMLSYSDTNAAKEQRATVDRRGLCGDVFLVGEPARERIDEVRIRTSVRQKAITVVAETSGLDSARRYRLSAKVFDQDRLVETFIGDPTKGASNLSFTRHWMSPKLWDLDKPQNQYALELTLKTDSGKVLDVQPLKRFGFRELWISGRDFILNGTRIFWSCVPVDNAGISAGLASYDWAKETFRRLKQIGVNMVYTHNYDCQPGSNLSFDEILQAADDEGVLVALTQPHFGDYDWSAPNADANNGYARHAEFFAKVAGNHPSVVAYSTSHNATGYNEDTDPDEIDGIHADRDSWAQNNMKKALRAQAIIERLDPSRIVYHHSSGNLGTMHTMNFYLNFVPSQEMDDWYEHWATVGVKPAFMVEFGVPFSWDWSLYRGWYKGQRSFGNAQVPWEYTMAEWNAQFYGDQAYRISEAEKANIRWEAQKFKTSEGWFRWDYPYPMGSTNPDFALQQQVWADYTQDNWRAFRTWGVSGISPWETRGVFWRPKEGVDRRRVELKTDWELLQRPGYSPDYVDGSFEQRDTAFKESDWVPTVGGEKLLANNGPLLAYIGGKPGAFTDKTHTFRPGELVRKQLIVINNSREPVTFSYTLQVTGQVSGSHNVRIPASMSKITLPTGQVRMAPIEFKAPPYIGHDYELVASVSFSNGQTQVDRFEFYSMPLRRMTRRISNLGLYDPVGETAKLLASLNVPTQAVKSNSDLAGVDTLIIGKGAMSTEGPGLDLGRVRDGLKVLMFEQTSDALEKRFGFRVEEYGLRKVFTRISGHPILSGLSNELLSDWRGSATLYPPRGTYIKARQFEGAPSVVRTGFLQPRVWRAGNRGNVASVLIEKPACGDFLPIIDGGFGLQYSPLMEYREGKGVVIFCQMDVTGRTEKEPAADMLIVNLMNHIESWKSSPERTVVVDGDMDLRRQLESSGISVDSFNGALGPTQVLVCSAEPGGTPLSGEIGEGRALFIGGSGGFNFRPEVERREYINAEIGPLPRTSPYVGIGSADVFNRDPRTLTLSRSGYGVLDASPDGKEVLFELAPWRFDPSVMNTKRVFRRTSFTLSRLLGNMGVHGKTPLLLRFKSPVSAGEQRWLKGFYLDTPVLEDDPYRFFGW